MSENPYAPPQDGQYEYLPHAKPFLTRSLLMLPFSLLAALAGGTQNENSSLMGIELLIHPMAPSGLMFGVFAGIAGSLIIPRRRLWVMPLVPVAGMLGFGVTGLLMNQADRHLQDGGNVAVFVAELCFASLTGMAMIAASFVMARIFSISSAIRFTIIGAFMGALCVVIVNGLPAIASFSSRLYWTMFCWQFLMMQFLAWLSIKSQPAP